MDEQKAFHKYVKCIILKFVKLFFDPTVCYLFNAGHHQNNTLFLSLYNIYTFRNAFFFAVSTTTIIYLW